MKPTYALPYLLIALALLLTPWKLAAQTFANIESNNIRLDPVWTARLNAFGFSWAYHIEVDASGNCYTTGYFQQSLQIDGRIFEPLADAHGFSRNPDNYFIAKHDKNGKFLWLRYAIGNARPTKIAIDPAGNINVVGSVYSKQLVFTSRDTTKYALDKPNDYERGIFIAKYDSMGRLLKTHFYSGGKGEIANDFALDGRGNLWIAGYFQFRDAKDRSSVKSSYFLLQMSPSYEVLHQLRGDTLASSHINSIFIDGRDHVYAAGGFAEAVKFGDQELRATIREDRPFLVKIDPNYKVEWAIDPLDQMGTGSGSRVVCDHSGNAYLACGMRSGLLYLVKVDRAGKVAWRQTIKARASIGCNALLIDAHDNIYMAGEGDGAVFGAQQPDLKSFKTKGGTDFYIAKYNRNGELLGLNAGGGIGTDYCKSIALYRDDLLAFGWYDNDFEFFETVMKAGRGPTFWIAKFDARKLESTDRGPQKIADRVLMAQAEAARYGVDEISCTCTVPFVKPERLAPGLVKNLATAQQLQKAIGWRPITPTALYDHIFYRNFYFSTTSTGGSYSLVNLAFEPIRFAHPDGTFALNLTPCTSDAKMYELPLHFNYAHTLRYLDPNFDVEAFDSTAKAFVDAFMMVIGDGNGRRVVLNNVLFRGENQDIQAALDKLSSKYGVQVSTDSEDEELIVDEILEAFESQEIDFEDYVLTEWVQDGPADHVINAVERRRLRDIFEDHVVPDPFAHLHDVLTPHIQATLETKYLGIEISHNMLRKWDGIHGQPAKTKSGEDVPATILATVAEVQFHNQLGVDAAIQKLCFSRSEITNTGILMDFENVRIIDGEKGHQYLRKAVLGAYPNERIRHPNPISRLPHFDQFTGLLVESARFHFQIQGKQIHALALHMLLNNKMLAAKITFPMDLRRGEEDSLVPTTLRLKVDEQTTLTATTADIKRTFLDLGFQDVQFFWDTSGLLCMYLLREVKDAD